MIEVVCNADGTSTRREIPDEIVDNTEEIIFQIEELRTKLSCTDYKAIKFFEGELTEEEYAPIKQQRKLWREKINNLENLLKNC